MIRDGNLIPVRIELHNRIEEVSLGYDISGPFFLHTDGSIIDSENIPPVFTSNSDIILNADERPMLRERKNPLEIEIEPRHSIIREYIPECNRIDPLYPPSSEGWLSRIATGGKRVTIHIHGTRDSSAKWICVVDTENSIIYEAHPILLHESGILELRDEFEQYTDLMNQLYPRAEALEWIEGVLEGPSPSWSELATITDNVFIPNLRLGSIARETMEQLVPSQYGKETREEIMAFLALATKWEFPREDPVDYFLRITSLSALKVLLQSLVTCLLTNERWPPYVQILQESAQYRLAIPTRPLQEAHRDDVWTKAHQRIYERVPSVERIPLEYAEKLNASGDVSISLPITRKQAAKSRKLWIDRYLLLFDGLRIRSHLRPKSLGLVRLIDVTRAHQWPHKHLKWSASIDSSHREPHIQMMETSPLSAEKVLRARPNIIVEEWSGSRVNTNLYNHKKNQWRISIPRIINSLEGNRTIRRLKNEFGTWKGKTSIHPTQIHAKSLDATSNLGFLASLEQENYLDQLELSKDTLLRTLSELRENSAIEIMYSPVMRGLMTTAVLAQGKAPQICSIARALLVHMPSATVSLGKEGNWLLGLIRLPTQHVHQLMNRFPSEATNNDVNLSCHRALAFRSYTWDFYQRLLQDDGSWDDDISDILSQIRA
ncbi:MAG: hypothetical protein ACFE7R_09335 [Candidatus Hodarchaeota archaeon]